MKRLKKGPEIKMPELRVPQFLVDVYRDLNERHLLPIVGLLIVAIVAVPFLLGGSDEEAPESAAVATPSSVPGANASSLVVVDEAPRLRKYERRLSHLDAKDPFAQQGGKGEEDKPAATETAAEASAAAESSSSGSSSSAESGAGSPAREEPGTGKSTTTYFTYAIDARVTPISTSAGKPSKADPETRKQLPPLTMLPSRETPALTYIGPSRDGKKAMMLVSDEVTAMFGDSNCFVGSEACQLLALEPGKPVTIAYGTGGRSFRIELQKIEVIFSDHLERAPLGDPKPKPQQHSNRSN